MGAKKRPRVNIGKILGRPHLRRELMISTLRATQAREGIDTTYEQTEHASSAVTEGESASFFDLERFRGSNKKPDQRENMFVRALRSDAERVRFDVACRDFATIDGAPLAYRRVGLVAHIFRDAPALDPIVGDAKLGAHTSEDERLVRHWWEIGPRSSHQTRTYVPFAKGGPFSRFYCDVYLRVAWDATRKSFHNWFGRTGRPQQRPEALDYYFKAGLTWPRRTQRGFNLRVMPSGCIFADKGPALFLARESDTWFLLGLANTTAAEYLLRGLMSFGSWEVGVIKRLPIPKPKKDQHARISEIAEAIHDAKASWDEGNQISTRFRLPWLLRDDLITTTAAIPTRLEQLATYEANREARIQTLYAGLDDLAYELYKIANKTRTIIEQTLGARPPEILWPQMENKSLAQKRMEHVFRLLSYVVALVVADDEDGIVPFSPVAGQTSLLDRVHGKLAALFPGQDPNQVEIDTTNELKNSVKGYRRSKSIAEWLDSVFFEYHVSLYKRRPILWHIASAQGPATCAFAALVDYHKFDSNRMGKLCAHYVRDAMESARRESALALKEERTDDRLDWQARFEEIQALDEALRRIREGHIGAEPEGPGDLRILTPWKSGDERSQGWDPDLDDGVKVNIRPLIAAGVLRSNKGLS
ncbi:MAG: BREX-1 system adenine-specific DNA-methyltransferase PglX [Proteobacteria bacterium]|nr:BREX-1 system adenine-specific DNA-methyltransferase PglX [Pseudomonadota bacterium]